MSNLTAWAGARIAFANAFLAADLNSLPNLASVLSSITFDNSANLDQFMDVSFVGAFASAQTVATGAGIGLWLAITQAGGSVIGDGRATPGAQIANTTWSPINFNIGGIPFASGTTITSLAGSSLSIAIPPQKITLIAQNQTGFALASSGNMISISTYRQNTNA